jgi:hypothetical protein
MAYSAYSQAWLEDPSSIRSIFVVATILYDSSGLGTSYISTPVYFSNAGFSTTDALISFNPIIMGDVSLTESISSDGGISMTFGGIRLANHNGELDAYLSNNKYIWVNKPIQIYLGDPTWSAVASDFNTSTTKFELLFNGIIGDIVSTERSVVDITLRDKLERLNSPITEAKFGTATGTWVNNVQIADTIKPLVFGEVFNMTPTLIDPNSGGGKYMVHDGLIESIIEIRDNGVPVYQAGSAVYTGATVDLTIGTFILTYPPSGAITVSVQGQKSTINLTTGTSSVAYTNSIANIIAVIVTQYGKANSRLTSADIDLVNFNAFNTSNNKPVGIIITDTTNVLSICQALAASIGSQIYFSREGKLQLIQYGVGIPQTQDTANITIGYASTIPVDETDMLYDSFAISSKLPFTGAVKLGYCRNWTVQDGLLTSIPADHKDMLATEWLTSTYTASPTMVANYSLDIDPAQKDTYLITSADALAEATRLVTYYSVQRYTYKFTGTYVLLSLRLGQQIYLRHYRFDLNNSGAGRLGQVVSLTPNWVTSQVEVEVLI